MEELSDFSASVLAHDGFHTTFVGTEDAVYEWKDGKVRTIPTGPKLLLFMNCVKLGEKNCVHLPSVGEQTAN